MYNYLEVMKNDIINYIDDNSINTEEVTFDELYDTLFIEDSVTGNASGSYTFNRCLSKEYVEDNYKLMFKMAREYDCKDRVWDCMEDDDWETIDVLIRCYLLPQALDSVL